MDTENKEKKVKSVSKSQRMASNKWDRENMRSLSCRLRTEEAEIFKQYCDSKKTTPGKLLKQYVIHCIKEYGEELRKLEQEGK
ncbi:MAG: hypothetical protein J1F60_02150 [Oscillospiraceae bacterium]|nr:hypothetical protein [Oscillospiraceae bacterium]